MTVNSIRSFLFRFFSSDFVFPRSGGFQGAVFFTVRRILSLTAESPRLDAVSLFAPVIEYFRSVAQHCAVGQFIA